MKIRNLVPRADLVALILVAGSVVVLVQKSADQPEPRSSLSEGSVQLGPSNLVGGDIFRVRKPGAFADYEHQVSAAPGARLRLRLHIESLRDTPVRELPITVWTERPEEGTVRVWATFPGHPRDEWWPFDSASVKLTEPDSEVCLAMESARLSGVGGTGVLAARLSPRRDGWTLHDLEGLETVRLYLDARVITPRAGCSP